VVLVTVTLVACSPSADTSTTSDTSAAPAGRAGRLETVIDGDSVRVVLDGVSRQIRLLGINAPERDECWADEARIALAGMTEGRLLTVVEAGTDQYGRLLAYLYDGGTNLNVEQVASGNAIAVATRHDLLPEFLAAEDDAARLGRGWWSPTACGPAREHQISIWAIEADAPGRDDTNPNGEYVVITNTGPPTDLTGWIVRDESSVHRYTFPDGFVLDTDGLVRVRSGCGDDDGADLHWCADTPVWNNAGDTVLLLQPSGAIADRERYFDD
jgi:micrococcal nuclease